MANEYINKVTFGGQTLIDLTQDTVTANDVAASVWFHLPSGKRILGTIVNGDNEGYGISNLVGSAIVGVSIAG